MYEYEKFGRKVEQETMQARIQEDMEYQWNKDAYNQEETNSLEDMKYTPAWTRQPRRDNKFKF